jgi:hypothetical protein
MTRLLTLLVVACILTQLACMCLIGLTFAPIRTGDGYIVTDFGGWDAELGIFLCPAAGYYDAAGNWNVEWTNPLAPIFPELITDC